jgi:hypothetical protein
MYSSSCGLIKSTDESITGSSRCVKLDITDIKPKLDETSTALLNKRASELTLEGETRRRKLYLLKEGTDV